MKVSDLLKPAVFRRLLLGYAIGGVWFWALVELNASLVCLDEVCPPGWRLELDIPYALSFLAAGAPIALLMSVLYARLRVRNIWAFVVPPMVLPLLQLLIVFQPLSVGDLTTIGLSTLGVIYFGALFYWLGWRPAWRAVGVEFSKAAP